MSHVKKSGNKGRPPLTDYAAKIKSKEAPMVFFYPPELLERVCVRSDVTGNSLTGHVVYINRAHRYAMVRYDGERGSECFPIMGGI